MLTELIFGRLLLLAKRVFISYRREDTAPAAGRVYDRLSRVLAKADVFFDVNTIGFGEDFKKRIVAEIGRSHAALIFIGDKWLEEVPPARKIRIWDTNDYVRAEVREVLARSILVVPILVSGAHMPNPEQLPDDIKAITTKHAVSLRHESFDDDTEKIVAAILGADARERDWERQTSVWSRIVYAIGGAAAAAMLLILVALMHFWLLARPLSASIGAPMTVLTAVATISLGGWIGLLRAVRKRHRR
jgi:hypothetical protein